MGGPELTIQGGGGQKCLCYIFGPYFGHFKSDYSGIKSKCEIHIMRPNVEKKKRKNFENWPSNRNFCLPNKNSEIF